MVRVFGHYIPRGLILLLLLEFCALFVSVHIAAELRLGEGVSPELFHDFNIKATVFSLTFVLIMIAVGLYQRSTRESFATVITRLFWASFICFWVLAIFFYLVPELFIGRGVFFISLILAFGILVVNRYLFELFSDHEIFKSRVLVIGTGNRAKQLARLRRKSDWRGINLIGFLHLKGDHDEVDAEDLIIRRDDSLLALIDEYGIDELILAVDDTRKNYPVDDVIQAKLDGVKITDITEFFERRTGRMEIDALTPNQVILFEGFDSSYLREMVKRLFDVVVSTVCLILTIPVMIVLWFLIKRESKWRDPVIYTQIRVGQHGKPFTIYKLRSMVVDAEANGAQYATKNDARVTGIGRIMRKTRLDEIPQMWNVLKGDMSFVGPRPERPEFVEKLNQIIPYYNMRHRVKPGITGWAQICYPYGDNDEDAKQKLQYDLYYIKNFSLFLDITTMIQTAQVIIWQKGAR
ncbi:TIGR03013 family XrtA/PEP-CTERM system glycosyltransferase [Pleionea sp. CnH1-48]|uniref:TIGR03013 family XrtA/PEP-CTERM system glycosyltransferase n=1 Tax=Pleionea sp. CnH1-48 TaxID=2954494 RepID=UPI00209694D6|nr:TIGR03013 family XrtA/PEP-CTERM system glycosyltransferase [Pleionea sp. CnH1-48]MCO7223457.1 TIGR03013 family PEP-CTERM/XrtA system glycosyltransferase [Pleionea sp. CnH1-48]